MPTPSLTRLSLALAGVAVAVYLNTLHAQFTFDDNFAVASLVPCCLGCQGPGGACTRRGLCLYATAIPTCTCNTSLPVPPMCRLQMGTWLTPTSHSKLSSLMTSGKEGHRKEACLPLLEGSDPVLPARDMQCSYQAASIP